MSQVDYSLYWNMAIYNVLLWVKTWKLTVS